MSGGDVAQALASVRPGMSLGDLARIAGTSWRPPRTHQSGRVTCFAYAHAFTAQADTSGLLGRVQFGRAWTEPNFSAVPTIAGLRIGMSTADAQKARPDLVIRPAQHPIPTSGAAVEKDGTRMRLQFYFDKLCVIEIFAETATYAPPLPTPYPAATTTPGAPFQDVNLKLAVMSEMLDRDLVDLGTPEELASFVLKREVDLEAEGYELFPEVLDYLARYPLTQAMLDGVDTLTFDGGSSIYPYVWRFWSGETEDFDVRSIEGIEACRNLESIHAIAVFAATDLRPLDLLPKLRRRQL